MDREMDGVCILFFNSVGIGQALLEDAAAFRELAVPSRFTKRFLAGPDSAHIPTSK